MTYTTVKTTSLCSSIELKEVSNVSDIWDVSDTSCNTKTLVCVNNKLVRFLVISWNKILSLHLYWKCWPSSALSAGCVTSKNISSPWLLTTHLHLEEYHFWRLKNQKSIASPAFSLFLLLTVQLNVKSVSDYHFTQATKEGSGCCCGSVFGTWHIGG